jgi:hypothetical protein
MVKALPYLGVNKGESNLPRPVDLNHQPEH